MVNPRGQQRSITLYGGITLGLCLIVGCDGCRRGSDGDETTFTAPPFRVVSGKAFPLTRRDAGIGGMPDGAVKPGHWTSASVQLQSNRDDRRGILQTKTGVVGPRDDSEFVTTEDAQQATVLEQQDLLATDGQITSNAFADAIEGVRRPVVLPKGQSRTLATRLLVPDQRIGLSSNISFGGRFDPSGVAEQVVLPPSFFMPLPPQAVFFVVLTDRPERFTRLQTADWVTGTLDETEFRESVVPDNYLIVLPPTEGVVPIAETALDWTSTAVLLWDNVPTRSLTPNQRQAIADWVRLGGTMIVNGPAAAEALADDALAEYLLIRGDGNVELPIADAAALIDSMSVATDSSGPITKAKLADGSTRVALAGDALPNTNSIGDGGLIVEGRRGRGRVVQSRIDLMSAWLTGWKSYDSFFNGGILRRPARKLVDRPWSLESGWMNDSMIRHRYLDWELPVVPADVNTGLRVFSRDAKLSGQVETKTNNQFDRYRDPSVIVDGVSGISGWKSESDWVGRCRDTLQSQIGVTIPKVSLIGRSLAIYLMLLIPVNYVIFRMIGRLEWAWLAVLPLSIGGAVVIARAAQLDVGFVRLRNEIALLEAFDGYPRGHLTRVSQIYNSLASNYDVGFETDDAIVDIWQTRAGRSRNGQLLSGRSSWLSLGGDDAVHLSNLSVGSNSSGGLHVEQIAGLGGSLQLIVTSTDELQVQNQTRYELLDCIVIRKSNAGLRTCVLGTLSVGETESLTFLDQPPRPFAGDLPLGIDSLMNRLVDEDRFRSGEMQLIGRIDGAIEGMTVTPPCRQSQGQTIVLWHGRHALIPPVAVDANLIGDFRNRQTKLPEDSTADETPTESDSS